MPQKNEVMFHEHSCSCQEAFVIYLAYVVAAFVSLHWSLQYLGISLVAVLVSYERQSSCGGTLCLRLVSPGFTDEETEAQRGSGTL